MLDQPTVSVVIPAYNAEKYLGEAIESVLRQTYPNWELIVVDDGSTDGTAAIAESFARKDKRIIYVYQTNQKMATARNTGIAKSRGKYIAFLDADNIFLPNKLEDQVAYMESHPECGLSYAAIRHFYDGKPEVLYTNKNEEPFRGEDLFRECLRRNFMNVLAVMVRKDVFEKYGAFQPGWYACDEQYVWINLAYRGAKFCHLGNVVGLSRLHRASDSARGDFLIRSAAHFLKMLDIMEARLTPAEKIKYAEDFKNLRRGWRFKLFLGKLMVTPPFSWLLMPLFLIRRGRNFIKLPNKQPPARF